MGLKSVLLRLLVIAAAFGSVAAPVHAQVIGGGDDGYRPRPRGGEDRPPLGQMPPDQRRQLRQEMREHWQQMPPEDRQRWREQRQDLRQDRQEHGQNFQSMPQEDRQRLRQEIRDQRGGWGDHHGGGGGGRWRGR